MWVMTRLYAGARIRGLKSAPPSHCGCCIYFSKTYCCVASVTRLSSLFANRDREHIPCGVRQPLLAPAPIVIGAGHRGRQVEIYVFIILEARRDAVDDAARRVLVFPGIEEHIVRVVASHAVQHRDIEGVQAENPIELIEREGLQPVMKRR